MLRTDYELKILRSAPTEGYEKILKPVSFLFTVFRGTNM
jgi:hypothetical protein